MVGSKTRTVLDRRRWPPPPRGSIETLPRPAVVVVVTVLVMCVARTDAQSIQCIPAQCLQNFTVAENIAVGAFVGTVGSVSAGVGPPFAEFFAANTEPGGADATQAFSLNVTSGRLTTKIALDRERTPQGYVFVVTTATKPIVVTVFLLDVNDNNPLFRPSSVTLEFSELAPVGNKKPLGSVTDPDLGLNTTQRCEIVSGNDGNAFSLQQKLTSEGSPDIILDLKVNTQLDYEQKQFYNLVIRATDGGGRTGEMTVRIVILDQNDNQPIFNNSHYKAQIAENVTVGTVVIQVQATDQDSGDNGKIRYSIDSKGDPEGHFSIDPATGVVRVNKPLDYESQPMFRLTLEATDNGPTPGLKGNAALDINLLNINEQPANIRLVFLQGTDQQRHIPENTKAGTPVARISIDDPDMSADIETNVTVVLHGGDDVFELRFTDDVLSLVVVNTPPDRERKAAYDLTVVATDSGNPPLRAMESFTVYIDDVNDNAPKFTLNPYQAEVQEAADIGTSVLRVTATDPDAGDNSKIVYGIEASSSPEAGWFQIDSSTGDITTRAAIDCELNSQPQFVVTARDNGDPPMSGSTTVVITVRDVNDKQPEFEISFYNTGVREDAAVGDCPVTVVATDPECGASAPVTYEMVRNGDAPPEFIVQQTTGKVCIHEPLDYERNTSYQFLVQAVDRDGLSASAVVQVTVTDVNDNSPYFEPQQYALNLEASVKPGPLVAVQGADLDSGAYGTVTYSFVNENDNVYFQIDAGSGMISLIKSFPVNLTTRTFRLNVQGTDGGDKVSEQPAQVQITVYKGDVHPPAFTQTMYNFSVVENVAKDTLVGRVEATVDPSTSTGAAVQYRIDYATRNWFRIDSTSGNIYTSSPLDREAEQFVLLSVRAETTDTFISSHAQVNFTLLDINDNSPFFPASSVQRIEVREETALQDPVYIAHAVDIDAGINGSIRYSLSNDPDSLFEVNAISGEVFVQQTLDYEKRHQYLLMIVASDQGTDGRRSASMTLTVNVKDINDHVPVFSKDVYDFYVSEDAPLGFTFGRVNATDEDSDHNGKVSYSLAPSPYLSVFGIFTVEGMLNTRDGLDRESQDLYTLTVVATDHGNPAPRSSTASVRIHITDTNDNDPEFSRTEYKFSIVENQPERTRIGQVTATDRDLGDNQRLKYELAILHPAQFVINPYNGEVTTVAPLDREEKEDYTLQVYVTDSGTPERSDSAVIKIKVLDMNDNRPVFITTEYQVSVPENRPKGMQVMKVVAQDKDAGDNGTVSFSINAAGSDADALTNFSIHPTTGWIITEEVLDYETKTRYRLSVLASDNGVPILSQQQTIVIEVSDDNDEAPLFHAKNVNFDVVENVSIGTLVGKVQAEDKDSGENGRVSYYVVGGNVFSLFNVDQRTGEIRTVRGIDYEESSSHLLSIQAIDNNAAFPRSSNISVTIRVIDINDNAPVFENDPVFLRTVRENTPIDHVVHTFVATDRDSGTNGTVRYSIVSEDASGPSPTTGNYFKIGAETGQLRVNKAIDYEQVHTISVIVQAQDTCPFPSKALSAKVTTVVFVLDVNDNRPEFESRFERQIYIFEDEPVDYPVTVIVAVDKDANQDSNENNVVSYGIVSGNEEGKFRLNSTTGTLTIAEELDRETRSSYVLNISAEDGGVPKMVAYQELRVQVEDVNDNPPVFQQSLYKGIVQENRNRGASVATVRATDNDIGMNGNLTYMIPNGIEADKFTVNPKTGLISTTEPLDREQQSSYTLTVYARDGGYPTLMAMVTVVVEVEDVNDHPPEFEKASYTLQVPENYQQTNIIRLVAADKDFGSNADIIYRITEGNDGKFSIDSKTGQLSCGALNREARELYTLTVMATDSGSPQQSGSTKVVVTVLDENDNSPLFIEPLYTATVPEDVAKGQTVMRVLASDPDQGQNGEVTYSLGNDTEGFFSVNSTSGDIITSGTFDREKNSSFVFYLVASDAGGSGPRNTSVRIEITIADVNDNAPVFRNVPYRATLPQSTAAQQALLKVTADDPDAGANGTVEYELINTTDSAASRQFFDIERASGRIISRQSLSSAKGYHSLLVLARDSGRPALSSTGVVEITVGDTFTPLLRFQKDNYSTEIEENSTVDTFVIRVQANYSGQGTVVYSFANGNDHNSFKIDPSTGEVKVADGRYLDYESTPQLQLIVSAVAGTNHAYATLNVMLLDKNDNSPEFAQTRYVSAIWENNQPQTYITRVIARDADSGKNGMVVYSIIDGNKDGVFEIYLAHTGIVRTNIDVPQLDREIQKSYTLTIEAQDMGRNPLRSTCKLYITIVDVNDNPPKFPNPGPGPVNISENRQAGFMVAVVTATDVDLNPVLVYSFTPQGNPDGAFSIDRSSGTVLLARALDREARTHYTIGLEVTDGKFTVTTHLEVYVQDENDNPPRFSRQNYEVSVPEQTPPSTSILTVTATDADAGINSVVTYSLSPTSASNFYIDPKNGTIFTNKTISKSSVESLLQLVVVARDSGSPPLSAMVAVQVQVSDVNKYRPVFNQSSYTAYVSELDQKGKEILRVSAVDDDFSYRPDNVHYVLVGPDVSTFYIQTNTGQILLNGPLDHEKKARYDITVMAVDRGHPPRNSTAPLTIYVTNENDNPPVFVQSHYAVELPEDYPKEQVFLTVKATDADDGVNSTLEFSITSGNSDGVFFNYKTGGLVVLTSLDYETRTSHRLIVRAVDCPAGSSCGGSPRLSAFVTVDINVTDVNEYDPKFPVAHYYASVAENVKVYMTVFQVHANDLDRGEYGRITYSIVQEKDAALFRINANSGDIISNQVFDYEEDERHVFNITIKATDPDGRSDSVGVTINVLDEDEYAPRFTRESYAFQVPGSAKAGMYVGRVQATDQDGGAAGRLVYQFNLPTDYFQIDPVSGNITVFRTLHDDVDKNESVQKRKKRALRTDSETLIVKVSSGLENSLSAQAFCTISIDRTCPGCEPPAALPISDTRGLSDVAIAMIVLVCILVPAIVVVLLLVFYCRRRNRKHPPPALQDRYGGRVNTLGLTPPPLEEPPGPPAYKDVLHFGRHTHNNLNHNHTNHHLHNHAVTSSDISEQSNNSASSGRGSAEVEDEDEEIRMINATNYLTNSSGIRHKTMPDSGIQQDDDTLSEPSATNHQEYLARLGIDSTKIGKSAKQGSSAKSTTSSNNTGGGGGSNPGDIAFSVESMHQFSDEGGGEGGVDFDADRLTDTETDEEMAMIENTRRHLALNGGPPSMVFGQPEPQQAGTLSNVVNSEEEYSGSYNWDYLLDWGPQYQPLAHVFAEIAKLKDESVTPKKTPVKTVPQRRIGGGAGLVAPQARIVPPPIITNAPPSVAMEPDRGRGMNSEARGRGGNGNWQANSTTNGIAGGGVGGGDASQVAMSSSSSSGSRSQRTSAMNSSLPSLPRSPISYESSYTSPALTPSFTPSLSPLGAHTPSISPAVSGHTSGHASGHNSGHASSSHSGHNTPGKPVSNHHHHPQHNYHNGHHPHARGHNNNNNNVNNAPRMTFSASSDSEREFRI